VISASDPALAVVGGLFLAALVVLMLVMLGTVLAISVALLIQLATPERVRAPTRREAAGETVSQEEVVARIRELPVGRGLPGEALEELASRAEVVEYPAGARIRQADGPDRRVLWVLSGHVELLRRHTEGGHSLAVALGPGEHFGDESLTDAAPRHDARARESVQLLALEGEAVADLSRAAEEGGRRAQETFEVARFLDGVSELAGLSPSARLELAFRVQEQEAAEGEAVIREGDPSDHMYLVRTGRCRVTRRGGDGGEQEVAEVGPGEAFGEVGLLYHRPRSATVTCLEPCRLVRVPRKALEQAMRQSFHVGLAMEELAENRLAELRG